MTLGLCGRNTWQVSTERTSCATNLARNYTHDVSGNTKPITINNLNMIITMTNYDRTHSESIMKRVIETAELNSEAYGRLCGLANELERLEAELSDSRLRTAIQSAVQLILGGGSGYTIGIVADHLNDIVGLL